ncbi:MAG: hypothetical protein WA210_14360 [Burkholderiaceae bacterium]
MAPRTTYHVLPRNDLRAHEMSANCWCGPRVDDEQAEELIVHNSLDGRERWESESGKPH